MIPFLIYCVGVWLAAGLLFWQLPVAARHVYNLRGDESRRMKVYLSFTSPFLIIAGLTAGIGLVGIGLFLWPLIHRKPLQTEAQKAHQERTQKKRAEMLACQKHHVELCRSGNAVNSGRKMHYTCPYTGQARYGYPPIDYIPDIRKYADDDY